MKWLSDEIEVISGYPASDFINNSTRTFASVIHPDDREQVERSVIGGGERRPPVHVGVPDQAPRRRRALGA